MTATDHSHCSALATSASVPYGSAVAPARTSMSISREPWSPNLDTTTPKARVSARGIEHGTAATGLVEAGEVTRAKMTSKSLYVLRLCKRLALEEDHRAEDDWDKI